jgi:hypothetical protein
MRSRRARSQLVVRSASPHPPNALCHPGGIALGAQAGPEALRQALADGGLRHFRVAAKTPFHMVIEARAR